MITGTRTSHLAKIILRNPMAVLEARIKSGFDSKVFHSCLTSMRNNKKYNLVESDGLIELTGIKKVKPVRHHINITNKGKG